MVKHLFFVVIAMIFAMTASELSRNTDLEAVIKYQEEALLSEGEVAHPTQSEMGSNVADTMDLTSDDQMMMPQKGETIVVLHVKNYGDIKLRLFQEESPKTVENFIGLAKQGYYDGVLFHRVIDNFIIQSGDPTGTGARGESFFGEPFENEYSEVLYPVRGALCMARKLALDTNESQFFIVQAGTVKQQELDLINANGGKLSKYAQLKFLTYGGAPSLIPYHHTTFGQVFEGMSVVDQIAAVQTTDKGIYDRPIEDIIIESVEIIEY